MNTKQQIEDDGFDEVEIGPPERGIPLPRSGGLLGRLRRGLERLEIGMSLPVLNVSLKQERYIRQRMPALGKEMEAKFSVRVDSNLRDRSAKRALRVFRIE